MRSDAAHDFTSKFIILLAILSSLGIAAKEFDW